MVSIEEWYKSLPPLTRCWFTGSVITAVLITTGIPPAFYLSLDWTQVLKHLQIWRLITCFFVFGKLGIGWLFSVYLIVQYFRALELNHYPGIRGCAELLFITGFCVTTILILAYFYTSIFPSITLLSAFIYIWSRRDPHQPIVIYGFTFQRWHLPAIMIAIQIVMGNVPFDPIFGILVGHLWLFLSEIIPRVYNKNIITIPEWWYEKVADYGQRLGGPAAAAPGTGPVAPDPRLPQRASWMRGAGHRLDQ